MTRPVPLNRQPATATMSRWMEIEVDGECCLFGFAEQHPRTGGLSWTVSTPIEEMTPAADRVRTASGRVYQLGRNISLQELDEEGRVALRLLVTTDDYPGRDDEHAWLVSCKMARHLKSDPPPRNDPPAVKRFLQLHAGAYVAKRRRLGSG